MGFEPKISAGERPQTYALARAATGTGHDAGKHYKLIITQCINLFKTYSKTYIHLFSILGGLFSNDVISSHCTPSNIDISVKLNGHDMEGSSCCLMRGKVHWVD